MLKWLAGRLFDLLLDKVASKRPPDMEIGPPEDPYLARWYVIPRNRFANVYLHQFGRSDDDRALHDHPWVNLSFVLNGSYAEVVPTKGGTLEVKLRQRGDLVFRWPSQAHRIVIGPDDHAVWTLFLTGPRIRTWGFWCPKGWVPWHRFVSPTDRGQTGRGCE